MISKLLSNTDSIPWPTLLASLPVASVLEATLLVTIKQVTSQVPPDEAMVSLPPPTNPKGYPLKQLLLVISLALLESLNNVSSSRGIYQKIHQAPGRSLS